MAPSIRRLYRLHESERRPNEVGPRLDWDEAERRFPECSAAWDRDGGGAVEALFAVPLTPTGVLVAVEPGAQVTHWYLKGSWVEHPVRIELSAGWIKLVGPAGTMFIPQTRSGNAKIQLVGPHSDQVPGSLPPARPNGKVSAEIPIANVDDDSIGAALDAVGK